MNILTQLILTNLICDLSVMSRLFNYDHNHHYYFILDMERTCAAAPTTNPSAGRSPVRTVDRKSSTGTINPPALGSNPHSPMSRSTRQQSVNNIAAPDIDDNNGQPFPWLLKKTSQVCLHLILYYVMSFYDLRRSL